MHERATNRATSGETRQNQKTATFPSLKGHSRDKQERDQNIEKPRMLIPTEMQRAEVARSESKKIVTARKNYTNATKDDHEAWTQNIHESVRKHEGVKKLHTTNTMSSATESRELHKVSLTFDWQDRACVYY